MTSKEGTRRRNHLVWIGAVVSLIGLVSYFSFFARFAALRDFPWVNLPVVLAGLGISIWALVRRRSAWSLIGLAFSGLCAGLLATYVFYMSNQLPGINSVVRVGEPAPEFALPDENHDTVRLSDFEGSNLVLVFYRGFW